MKQADTKKHFVFTNRANDLYSLLLNILDFVKRAVDVDETAGFKLKVIVTELLTNAVKHSHCINTFIDVAINGREIDIIKSDFGNTFSLNIDGVQRDLPLPGRHIHNQAVRLYGDSNYTLMAKIENNCGLSFFIEEQLPSMVDVSDSTKLSEHFGLMIITRACDTFKYEFDIDSCANNFIAKISM